MVFIPAGTFTMGTAPDDYPSDEWLLVGKRLGEDRDEMPAHEVSLSAFCIDRTEVTVAAYRKCVDDGANRNRCPPSPRMSGAGGRCNWYLPDRDLHPMNCVHAISAASYCKWATGGDLPTEAQWEYAARGVDGRKFPWGNAAPAANLLNACGSECLAVYPLGPDDHGLYGGDDRWPETAPVGTYPDGASPFGLLDMAGNVREWVADAYAPYTSSPVHNPRITSSTSESRVLRGSTWHTVHVSRVRSAFRTYQDWSYANDNTGFRCAAPPLDAPEEERATHSTANP
jgi:formylglycine-generating enzyme required for sulfatase activity